MPSIPFFRGVLAFLSILPWTAAAAGEAPASEPAKGPEAKAAPDKVSTAKGDLLIAPIQHATLVLQWDGKTIYVDPVEGAGRFAGFPPPDMILITHIHGDHMDAKTVKAVAGAKTVLVAPRAVAEALKKADESLGKLETKVLAAGEKTTVAGVGIEAILAYNLATEKKKFHEKGRDNGYVLDLAGTRVYLSGDTEDTPEMRALEKIDVAFVAMNRPFSMTEEQAAGAVLAFQPKIVYPYHCRGSDLKKFATLVQAKSENIEVRLRDWYAKR